MKKCANCVWFEPEDEGDGYICTLNPPDYKGQYAKTFPGYRCGQYESREAEYEIKADYTESTEKRK